MGSRRSGGGPGAEVVVGHHVVPVHVSRGAQVIGCVDLAAGLVVSSNGRCDHLATARGAVEHGSHQVLVSSGATGITGETAGIRVFPIQVDAVEDARPARIIDQVPAGSGEGCRVGSSLSETTGPGPAAEGPEDAQAGVQGFEFTQLADNAGVVGVRVGDTAHAISGAIQLLIVGISIANCALAAGGIAECEYQVGQLGGRAAGLELLGLVVADVDVPVGIVHTHAADAAATALRGSAGGSVGWPGGRGRCVCTSGGIRYATATAGAHRDPGLAAAGRAAVCIGLVTLRPVGGLIVLAAVADLCAAVVGGGQDPGSPATGAAGR